VFDVDVADQPQFHVLVCMSVLGSTTCDICCLKSYGAAIISTWWRVYTSANYISVHNIKIIPINGSVRFLLNSGLHLASGTGVCVEYFLLHNILPLHFLGQCHPHDESCTWRSDFLEQKFIIDLDHFFTCVYTEVIHPFINEMDEGAIFGRLFVDKK